MDGNVRNQGNLIPSNMTLFGWLAVHSLARSRSIALAFTLFYSAALFAGPVSTDDSLWRKAVAIAETNVDWVPGLTVTRVEIFHKDKRQGLREIWQRSKLGEKRDVIREVVKVLEDGKDVTEEEKKDKEKSSLTIGSGAAANPFHAEAQKDLTLKTMDSSRIVDGKDCIAYVFELKNKNSPTVSGTAWLEKGTGLPVAIENMTFDPFPDKHVKRMSITTHYESNEDGSWRPKETVTAISMRVMFMNLETRTTMSFSEYWKKPRSRTVR